MDKELKSTAKCIFHIEAAARIAENVGCMNIAQTRDGLRAMCQTNPAYKELLSEAADFIQTILDAKHRCKSVHYAGNADSMGKAFTAEFESLRPSPNEPLAKKLRDAAWDIRQKSGIGDAEISVNWGDGVAIKMAQPPERVRLRQQEAAAESVFQRRC